MAVSSISVGGAELMGKWFELRRWWEDAKRLHDAQIDDLNAGRRPRIKSLNWLDGQATDTLEDATVRLKDICNAILTDKQRKLDAGQNGKPMLDEYEGICRIVLDEFGKYRLSDDLGPADLASLRHKLSTKWGSALLANALCP